jgi:hypothetical protein
MVSAGLYTLLIDLRSLLKESSFPSIRALISSALTSANTTGEAVDDTDTDTEDPLFVPKRAQTPLLSTQSGTRKRQERHNPASPEQRICTKPRRSKRIRKKLG